MKNELRALNIQLFAEGSGDGAGAADTGAAVSQPQSGEAKVVYGKQPESADGTPSVAGEESGANNSDKKKSYEELIKGEFKSDYNKDVNHIVGKRIAQERERMRPLSELAEKLMVRYEAEDFEDLLKKIDDDSVFEAMSIEKGKDPEVLKELEGLRVFQNRMHNRMRMQEAEREADMQHDRWVQEAEEIKKTYPGFNLEDELQNPQFRSMITTKNPQYQISMLDAYKMLHHEELVKAAEEAALSKAAKSVSVNAARPSENGLGNQSGVIVKNDVSKLTKKERADIARRVARGERIEF